MKPLIFAALVLLSLSSMGQKIKPTSTNDFVLECMKTNGEVPHKQTVIWFPYNFWQIAGDQMKLNPEFMQHILSEMSNYMMFAVVDYTVYGSRFTFRSDDEIRKSITLYDSSKNAYSPIANEDITPTASELLTNLKPVMAQLLGQFGEGMRVFLFNSKKINGKPIIDITRPNSFTLRWDQTSLKWTLPLASVLPPKKCPIDGELMKGTWLFCPIHGTKLDQ